MYSHWSTVVGPRKSNDSSLDSKTWWEEESFPPFLVSTVSPVGETWSNPSPWCRQTSGFSRTNEVKGRKEVFENSNETVLFRCNVKSISTPGAETTVLGQCSSKDFLYIGTTGSSDLFLIRNGNRRSQDS